MGNSQEDSLNLSNHQFKSAFLAKSYLKYKSYLNTSVSQILSQYNKTE